MNSCRGYATPIASRIRILSREDTVRTPIAHLATASRHRDGLRRVRRRHRRTDHPACGGRDRHGHDNGWPRCFEAGGIVHARVSTPVAKSSDGHGHGRSRAGRRPACVVGALVTLDAREMVANQQRAPRA